MIFDPTDRTINHCYDCINDANAFNTVIRYLKLNKSLDEKGKLIDELLIRKCKEIRTELFEFGLDGLTRIKKENEKK